MTVSAAVPNTYHQLAALRGTRCSETSRMGAANCRRRSNHSPICEIRRMEVSFRRARHFARVNGDQTVLHFGRIFKEAALRRTRSARAVAVISSAVARAHEQAGLREPAHRTPQVRTVDSKYLELVASNAPHPA